MPGLAQTAARGELLGVSLALKLGAAPLTIVTDCKLICVAFPPLWDRFGAWESPEADLLHAIHCELRDWARGAVQCFWVPSHLLDGTLTADEEAKKRAALEDARKCYDIPDFWLEGNRLADQAAGAALELVDLEPELVLQAREAVHHAGLMVKRQLAVMRAVMNHSGRTRPADDGSIRRAPPGWLRVLAGRLAFPVGAWALPRRALQSAQ